MRCSYHVKLRLSLRASQSAKDATSCSGLAKLVSVDGARAKNALTKLCSTSVRRLIVERSPCPLGTSTICVGQQQAELGVQPWIIETILNHVSGHKAGVAGVYNRSKHTDAMREALQNYADWLERITA